MCVARAPGLADVGTTQGYTSLVRRPLSSLRLYKLFLVLYLSLVAGSAVESFLNWRLSAAKGKVAYALVDSHPSFWWNLYFPSVLPDQIFDIAFFSMVLFLPLAAWELFQQFRRKRESEPLNIGQPGVEGGLVWWLRIADVICLVAAAVPLLSFLLFPDGMPWIPAEYLLFVVPYLLIGLGLLRERPYGWILALPLGGMLPVGGLLTIPILIFALNLSFAFLVPLLFFACHAALAWIAFRLLREEYDHSPLIILPVFGGAILFLFLAGPALVLYKD